MRTAGVALTDFSFSSSYSDNAIGPTFPGGTGSTSISTVKTGWTVGGGGEWLLDSRWSIKAEYLYLDFGSTNFARRDKQHGGFHADDGGRCGSIGAGGARRHQLPALIDAQVAFFLKKARDGVGRRPRSSGAIGSIILMACQKMIGKMTTRNRPMPIRSFISALNPR